MRHLQVGRTGVGGGRDFRFAEIERGRRDIGDFDIARILLAPEHRLEIRLGRLDIVVIQLELLEDRGHRELRLEHVLLLRGAGAILCGGRASDPSEIATRLFEQVSRSSQKKKIERVVANLLGDIALRREHALAGGLGVLLRLRGAEPQLSGTGNLLREAESGVIEIARFIAGKRLRTADAQMLQRDFRVGKCGGLDWHARGCLPMALRRGDLRARAHRLDNQRVNRDGHVGLSCQPSPRGNSNSDHDRERELCVKMFMPRLMFRLHLDSPIT